jgi:hypothetical protein
MMETGTDHVNAQAVLSIVTPCFNGGITREDARVRLLTSERNRHKGVAVRSGDRRGQWRRPPSMNQYPNLGIGAIIPLFDDWEAANQLIKGLREVAGERNWRLRSPPVVSAKAQFRCQLQSTWRRKR